MTNQEWNLIVSGAVQMQKSVLWSVQSEGKKQVQLFLI